jgi:hypothetical protein
MLTLPPFCAVVMKSGNLNFLEPSGPLEACNVTALSLPLPPNIGQTTMSFWCTVLNEEVLGREGKGGRQRRRWKVWDLWSFQYVISVP